MDMERAHYAETGMRLVVQAPACQFTSPAAVDITNAKAVPSLATISTLPHFHSLSITVSATHNITVSLSPYTDTHVHFSCSTLGSNDPSTAIHIALSLSLFSMRHSSLS